MFTIFCARYGAVGFGLGYFFGLDPAAVGIFIVVYSLLDNDFFPFLKYAYFFRNQSLLLTVTLDRYRAVGTLASYSLRSLVGTLLTLVAFLVSFFLTSQLKGKDCPSLLPAAGLLWITMKAVIFIKSVGEI